MFPDAANFKISKARSLAGRCWFIEALLVSMSCDGGHPFVVSSERCDARTEKKNQKERHSLKPTFSWA